MHEDEERTLATWTAHRRIIDDLIAADGGDLGVPRATAFSPKSRASRRGSLPRWASSRRSRKPTERSTFQHGQQTA